MDRVVAYIDGFNLYFGLKADHNRRYLWLDLQALVESLLLPDQDLRGIWYFTARVRDDPDGARRQSEYLDALASYCQKVVRVEGRFQEKNRSCGNCGARWVGYVDAYIRIGPDKIRRAQLPPKVVTEGGVILERPGYWR